MASCDLIQEDIRKCFIQKVTPAAKEREKIAILGLIILIIKEPKTTTQRKNSYTRSDNTNNKRAKNNHPKAFFDQLYQTLMGGYASYKIQPPAWPVHYRMAGIIATASVTALIVYCIPRIIMHFAFCIEVIMYKLHSYAF